ncbi:MAG: AAA family ATPase [Candidatus Thiodiazotropha taylori]|uniref:AAA family ATPase n=1 Tax=Candidatus Thiodiazotropha taylori TaxID=2792791 RepID=A0A9E4T391_9GAMM|nr:AAA family ATPase [Candidatus Thiodiazotropha taylori]MCW4258172.1 AAA family ATPase [Candidatus Thiodiazotropha taylori]
MVAERVNGADTPLKLDLQITIGKGYGSSIEQQDTTWANFIKKLSVAAMDSSVTIDEYHRLPKEEKRNRKSSRGYFIGAITSGPVRNNQAVIARSLATIDVEGSNTDIGTIEKVLHNYEFHWYETRSSKPGDRRYRLTLPLVRNMGSDAYQRCVSNLCDQLEFFGIDVDRGASRTISQPAFFPTVSSNQDFKYGLHTGEPLGDVQEVTTSKPMQAAVVDLKPKHSVTTQQLHEALAYLREEADDRDTWIRYGMALYHQYDGDIEGLEIWDHWSEYSDKYPGYEDIANRWSGFHVAGPTTITVGSILDAAKKKGYVRQVIEVDVDPPQDLLSAARIDNYLDTEAPPIDWLVSGLIPLQKVGMIVAPGGTGKSFAMMQLGFSVASGAPYMGHWEIGDIGGVLILAAEDDQDDIHRRLEALVDSYIPFFDGDENLKAKYLNLARKNLFILSRVGKTNLLTVSNGHGDVIRTKRVDELADLAKLIPNIRLIIIDPVKRFAGGDENNPEDMTRFVETMEIIRARTGATILAVHHSNKTAMRSGGALNQEASRGSSALTDAVRWQANLARMHPDDATRYGISDEDIGRYVAFGVAKTNYTAPLGQLWLHRGPGGILQVVELNENAPVGRSDVAHDEALERIVEVVEMRDRIGDQVSLRGLQEDYAGRDGQLGFSKARVRELVDDLLETGRLKQQPGGRGGGFLLVPGGAE